jgi:hypothetical protein
VKTLGPQTNKPLSLILHCDLIFFLLFGIDIDTSQVLGSAPLATTIHHRMHNRESRAANSASRYVPFPPSTFPTPGLDRVQHWPTGLGAISASQSKADQKEACQVPDFVTGYLPSQKKLCPGTPHPFPAPHEPRPRHTTYHLHQHTPPSLIYPTSSLSTYVYGKALFMLFSPLLLHPSLAPHTSPPDQSTRPEADSILRSLRKIFPSI